ncbi:MAG: hypothetical protein K0R58_9 [Ramlibacter sp.]|jgi:hypothetical protein|nr:hypothetical protein [Ramlibacter sp.]
MSKVKLMTQAEYAAHRGCSGVAVHKAVKAGRISLIGDKIDPAVADIQWAANTRARQRNVGKQEAAGADLVDQASGGSAAPSAPAAAAAPAAPDTGYTAARAERERAEADKAKMEVAKLRGELVAWQDVSRGGFEVGRDLRDTMESAVNSLAAELASEVSADKCAEILRRHHRAVCDVLVKAWREKIGPVPTGVASA